MKIKTFGIIDISSLECLVMEFYGFFCSANFNLNANSPLHFCLCLRFVKAVDITYHLGNFYKVQ